MFPCLFLGDNFLFKLILIHDVLEFPMPLVLPLSVLGEALFDYHNFLHKSLVGVEFIYVVGIYLLKVVAHYSVIVIEDLA